MLSKLFAALIFVLPLAAQPEAQITKVRDLIAAHRASMARLASIAQSSAEVLLKGGGFFLCCGESPWMDEGDNRAGGPIGLKVARNPGEVADNSLVWISYNVATLAQTRADIAKLPRGARVVAFGPKPESPLPEIVLWLDSLTPPDADPNFTLMGNVLSLWSLTGELAMTTARAGKTMAFYQSAWTQDGNARNQSYQGQLFHKRLPRMQASEPGELAGNYLDFIAKMIASISETELPAIKAVGRAVAEHAQAGRLANLVVTSHLMSSIRDPLFKPGAEKLTKDDYLVSLGYSGVDENLWKAVHSAGAGAAWALASTVKSPEAPTTRDTMLNEYWEPGDAAVAVWGYDVPILPPSGIAQLFIYQLIVSAAR